MKILFLSNYFPPEIGTGPFLPYELAETLAKRRHDVTVVTNFPRYNINTMPGEYRRRFLKNEMMSGICVCRINGPNYYGGSRFSRKLVQLFAPPVLGWRAGFCEKPDIVYTVTPPILMGTAAIRVAKKFGVPCVVNVQDLFPQNMIDLGVVTKPWQIKLFESWEKRVYDGATAITVMSDGNRDFVVNKGADPEKVYTVFNWVDTESIVPMNRLNTFREQNGISSETFVVTFAGTMGISQGLEVIVEAAKFLRERENLLFLMIGDGTERAGLEAKAEGLSNIRFLPMQSKEVYPFVLGASDVCLATLLPEVKTPTVPSKIATIMSAGRPVLAAFPPGDAPKLIEQANAGIVIPPGNASALAEAVVALQDSPEKSRQFGESGRRFVVENLARNRCISRIEEILAKTCEQFAGKKN